MKNKKLLTVMGLALPILLVQGCSSLGIGESEFSCPGKPGGTQCKSSWELYEMTNNGNLPNATQTQEGSSDDSNTTQSEENKDGLVNSKDSDFIVDNYVSPRLPDRPVPVRTPAQVMRIWIAPYEDVEGDFIVSGYAYTEIEPRKWTLGVQDVSTASGRVFEPLKAKTNK